MNNIAKDKDEFDKIFNFKPKIFPTQKVLERSKVAKKKPRKEEVMILTERTDYTEEEILGWFSRFQKVCPEAFLTRKKVIFTSF